MATKRYTLLTDVMVEADDGQWVRAADYDLLYRAARAALASNPLMTGKPQITIDVDAWDALRAAAPVIKVATPEDR